MAPPLKSRSVMLTGSIVLARFSSYDQGRHDHSHAGNWGGMAETGSPNLAVV